MELIDLASSMGEKQTTWFCELFNPTLETLNTHTKLKFRSKKDKNLSLDLIFQYMIVHKYNFLIKVNAQDRARLKKEKKWLQENVSTKFGAIGFIFDTIYAQLYKESSPAQSIIEFSKILRGIWNGIFADAAVLDLGTSETLHDYIFFGEADCFKHFNTLSEKQLENYYLVDYFPKEYFFDFVNNKRISVD